MANIRKHGSRWQVRIRRADCCPLSKSFERRKDAMEWARQMEVQADRQELPADVKILQRNTLGDLVARYRDEVSVAKKGYEQERSSLTAFLRHPICKRRLEWGIPIRDNPLDKLKLKAPSQRRERRLTSGEWERLLEAARLTRNQWVEPIVRLACATAMRRGEILAIEASHVSLEKRTLLIPVTKNGHARTIPLTQDAILVLQGLPKAQGYLFPITGNALRLAWIRLRNRAGLNDFRFHDLRHEAISQFFELGLNAAEVALISGHNDMRMLFRYTHPMRSVIAEKLSRHAHSKSAIVIEGL
jgi:integrase